MPYTIIPYDDSLAHDLVRIIIDKDSDISELPTDFNIGSKAIVVESGNVYFLNSEHK